MSSDLKPTKEEYLNWINPNFKYKNPAHLNDNGEEEFPIIGMSFLYGTISYEDENTPYTTEFLDQIKAAGFNVGTPYLAPSVISETLDNAHKSKFNIFINCNDFGEPNGISNVMANLENPVYQEAFVGVFMPDEPKMPELELETQPGDKSYTFWQKYYNIKHDDIGKNSMVLINNAVPKDGWDTFLKIFQHNFLPSIFCYDMYPIREINKLIFLGMGTLSDDDQEMHEGDVVLWSDVFYDSLEKVSNYIKECLIDRPFWTICLSVNMLSRTLRWYYPLPLEKYLRFEAFSSLAYGAQGIVYWPYSTRDTNDTETFMPAMLDRRGKKTAAWYYARNVNMEIQKYKDVFLGCKVQDIRLGNLINVYSNSTCSFIIRSSFAEGLLVSRIINNDYIYIIVVSTSVVDYQDLTVRILKGSLVELTPVKSNGDVNTVLPVGTTKRILIPGGYRIFRING